MLPRAHSAHTSPVRRRLSRARSCLAAPLQPPRDRTARPASTDDLNAVRRSALAPRRQGGRRMAGQDSVEATLGAYKAAVYDKDVEAFVSLYDEAARTFDMWGSWSYEGTAAIRRLTTDW